MNQVAPKIVVNEPNRWRLDTPGAQGWPRSPRPDAARKYFMVSADGHANEPANLWVERIEPQYKDRLPRVITDKDGVQWRVSEGHRPDDGDNGESPAPVTTRVEERGASNQ